MIKIEFHEPTTDAWREWCATCTAAAAALIDDKAKRNAVVIRDSVYKGQKDVYMSPHGDFHGKCAYCESLIDANQPGDLEHFRPKKAVTDFAGKSEMVDDDGTIKAHPGYYWLAYDWRNLLPACWLCNSVSTQKTAGKRTGKGNYFPVQRFRAINPGDEAKEEPLLINPALQDPSLHLEIDDTGIFTALSTEGEECIKVFGLNKRESLVDERKRTFEAVGEKLLSLVAALIEKSAKVESKSNELRAIRAGERAYSAASFAAIKNLHPSLKAFLDQC